VRGGSRLPRRMPEGTKYVVESDGAWVRRFVELPNGKKIILPSRKASRCGCGERVSIVPEQEAQEAQEAQRAAVGSPPVVPIAD
jgi:hypothetical protein